MADLSHLNLECNAKGLLLEAVSKQKGAITSAPVFSAKSFGSKHALRWAVTCSLIDNKGEKMEGMGNGIKKKEAEQLAAAAVLKQFSCKYPSHPSQIPSAKAQSRRSPHPVSHMSEVGSAQLGRHNNVGGEIEQKYPAQQNQKMITQSASASHALTRPRRRRRKKGPLSLRILFIVSSGEGEEEALLSRHEVPEKLLIDETLDLSVYIFPKDAHRVYLMKAGTGVSIAMLKCFLAVTKCKIDFVVVGGIACSVSTDTKIGELVLVDRVIQHDVFLSGPQNGIELTLPGSNEISEPPEHRQKPVMKTDADLNNIIKSKLHVDHRGTLMSGNEFIHDLARRRHVARLDPTKCALINDTETAGIAQICTCTLDTPFVVLKTVCDAIEKCSENSYRVTIDEETLPTALSQNVITILDALPEIISESQLFR